MMPHGHDKDERMAKSCHSDLQYSFKNEKLKTDK